MCTNDQSVCEYWNSIDKQLEVEIDIIDDVRSEALEMRKANSWFTYGEPLHRLREFGIAVKEIDLLDEKKLSMEQMRLVVSML